MFSTKQAGQIAAQALETQVGSEAAQEYRQKFEPWYSEMAAPERGLSRYQADDFASTVGRLMHVQSPEVLGALGRAASAGDRQAMDLLVEIVTDRNGRLEGRLLALETLARIAPAEAGTVAVRLMNDDAVSNRLAETLVAGSRNPALLPALERLANQPEFLRHEKAMNALIELGEPGSEVLARCLTSAHFSVRNTAANALIRLGLSTPTVRAAITEMLERFGGGDVDDDNVVNFQHLNERLGFGAGFRWKLHRVAKKTLEQLEKLEEPPAPEKGPGLFNLRNVFRARVMGEGPEAGLLDWGRSRNQPLSPEERVAQSLVKLAMLRPELLFELAEARFDRLGVTDRIGNREVSDIEIWRGEQRDARLFEPFAHQLKKDPAFRDRVRRAVEALAL